MMTLVQFYFKKYLIKIQEEFIYIHSSFNVKFKQPTYLSTTLITKTQEELYTLITSKSKYLGFGIFIMISISSIFYCFWCCKIQYNSDNSNNRHQASQEITTVIDKSPSQNPIQPPDLDLSTNELKPLESKSSEEEESPLNNNNNNNNNNSAVLEASAAALVVTEMLPIEHNEPTTTSSSQIEVETSSVPITESENKNEINAPPLSSSTAETTTYSQPHTTALDDRFSDMSDVSTTNNQTQYNRRFKRRLLPGTDVISSARSSHSVSSAAQPSPTPAIAPSLEVVHAFLERSVSRIVSEAGVPDPKAGYLRKLGQSGWGLVDRYFTLVRGVLTNFLDESHSHDSESNREDKYIKLTGFNLQVIQADQLQFILEGPLGKKLVLEVRKDNRKKIEFALWSKALTEHVAYANGYFHLVSAESTATMSHGMKNEARRRKSGSSSGSF
jgi:hypothetical protein